MSKATNLVYGEFVSLLGEREDVETLPDSEVGKLIYAAREKYGVNISERAAIRIRRKARDEIYRRRRKSQAVV